MKTLLLSLCCFLFTGLLNAQTVLDGAYVKEHNPTRKKAPDASLREADVLWSKRVWREIDLRQKMNLSLFYPEEPLASRKSLFDIIRHCLLVEGSMTAYSAGPLLGDDEFTQVLNYAELDAMLMVRDTVETDKLDGSGTIIVPTEEPLSSRRIKKYKIKEDWFYDKQTSTLQVRIIGIAPMKEVLGPDGELRGYAEMFWLYFPECRYTLANYSVFNRQNNGAELTYEDVFLKRMFASYIIKESNVYDRRINEEYGGVNALLEAERLQLKQSNMEHDLYDF